LCTQGKLVEQDPLFQFCQTISNECYGMADKVCGWYQWDKKMCQDMIVEGESFYLVS